MHSAARVDILVTTNLELYHASKTLSGLAELAARGEINLSLDTRHDIVEQQSTVLYLRVARLGERAMLAACDLADSGRTLNLPAIDRVDVYFKRSLDREYLSSTGLTPKQREKIRPFGLNFACLSPSARWLHARIALVKFGRRGHPDTTPGYSPTGRLKYDLSLLKGNPRPENFEPRPDSLRHRRVVFQSRAWPSSSSNVDVETLNRERAAVIAALRRELPAQSVTGLVPDDFARSHFPELVLSANTYRASYVDVMKSSRIGVNTRGLQESTAFKLAEYLAAGLAVVSEPIAHEAAPPLTEGLHFLGFTTPDECVRQCRRLLEDDALFERMKMASVRYYRDYVHPIASVRRLLSEVRLRA
jgi:hypothetical protein